jgi:hypothetical protein
MKKTLKTNAITNELEASAFFAHKKPQPVQEKAEPLPVPPVVQETPHVQQPISNVPTNEPTVKRTFQRRKVRHTFDIYDDQLFSLKEIALARQKLLGERVLLGELVQEALDAFISKERTKEGENEPSNGRSF